MQTEKQFSIGRARSTASFETVLTLHEPHIGRKRLDIGRTHLTTEDPLQQIEKAPTAGQAIAPYVH